jgi:hypothetical protein
MGTLQPVLWLNTKDEIKKILNTAVNNPKVDNEVWLNKIAEYRKDASLNIANTLISCT